MRYQGGKVRLAKPISETMINIVEKSAHTHTHTLVSLFCGSCAIEIKLTSAFDRVICNDKHEYLIEMFKALQNGYDFPDNVSYEQWDYCRKHLDEDKALSGFIGFGCSFGGRFFQGYARCHVEERNYAKGTKKSLLKDIEQIKKIEFVNLDYRDVKLPDGCIVYCDPPYASTKDYAYQGKFDSNEFWEYMRKISKNHLVFISEENAPEDFISIWEQPLKRTLCVDKSKYADKLEHLYIHKLNYNKLYIGD